jgi:hypothetical protein
MAAFKVLMAAHREGEAAGEPGIGPLVSKGFSVVTGFPLAA